MAVMNDFVLLNAAIDAAGLTTPGYLLGPNNNAVSATLTVVAGATPAADTLTAQQSNDGVNWKTFSNMTVFDNLTAPDMTSDNFGGTAFVLTMKYVRFLLKGPAAGYMIVNLTMNPHRAA